MSLADSSAARKRNEGDADCMAPVRLSSDTKDGVETRKKALRRNTFVFYICVSVQAHLSSVTEGSESKNTSFRIYVSRLRIFVHFKKDE